MSEKTIIYLTIFVCAWLASLLWSIVWGCREKNHIFISRIYESGLAICVLVGFLSFFGAMTGGFTDAKNLSFLIIIVPGFLATLLGISSVGLYNKIAKRSWNFLNENKYGINDNDMEDIKNIVKKHIGENKTAAEIAGESLDRFNKIEEIKKTTDQNRLGEIVKNETDSKVRLAAVNRLTDQNILADLLDTLEFSGFVDSLVREGLEKKLYNQHILVSLAKQSTKTRVRCFAASKILDQDILAEIAQNDTDMDVRLMAIRGIERKENLAEFQTMLTEVLVHSGVDKSPLVEKILDDDTVKEIARTCQNAAIRESCCKRLGGHFPGEQDCACPICGVIEHNYKEIKREAAYSGGGEYEYRNILYKCLRCGAERVHQQ